MMQKGFTLVELVITLIVLALLAALAIPKFINLTSQSRIAALQQINTSVTVANDFMFFKSQLPSYAAQPVPNRDDLIDVDTNGDGTYDTRLKWFYLDNTDIEKRIDLSEDFIIEYQGYTDTYIGYDFSLDGAVRDDLCYFRYTQAAAANTPPQYQLETSGC
ncbi:type II secretion system protein [Motilimonas pumila]|uniref:Prepilin-type N-terminal cleavage/methylation domain-containing protein n=1 Tax=Motilimonas pumila TaxID=2303987 RepID=A0A418YIZ3_9GAMM|nr:prepilin-type N-terminal cleavage/methylation domain-containing protein [Motilimonas pumila]RJG50613.1 prepilin-type N-terminal cleavage/methylation domain-containing protein [Motilimonas pumila]